MYYLYAVLSALVLTVNAKNSSPCPGLFSIIADHPDKRQEASLTLYSEEDLHGLWVRLIFDSASKEIVVQVKYIYLNIQCTI